MSIGPTEAQAIEFLRVKFPEEKGWLVIPQVRNGVGFTRTVRTADAIICQLWPSRGLSMTGVEYKRTKHDWQRELKNPAKAEEIAAYCHHWVILAPRGVIDDWEIPAGWGFWEIDGDKLKRTRTPPDQAEVKPLDYSFVFAMLRAVASFSPDKAVIQAARDDSWSQAEGVFQSQLENREEQIRTLKKTIQDFEQASGISIHWDAEKVGRRLGEFLRDPDQFMSRIRSQRANLQRVLDVMDEVLGDD